MKRGSHKPGDRKGKGQSGTHKKGSRSKTSWQVLAGHAPEGFQVQEGDSYQAMEESASQTHVLKISEMYQRIVFLKLSRYNVPNKF